MRRKIILALSAFLFYLVSSNHCVFAQYGGPGSTEMQEGRYVLVTVNKAATYAGSYGTSTRKIPAIVLDTYLGIIWRCKDIRDEKPLWIKNDLAKNTGMQLSLIHI